jgi:hypothetical protein
MTKCRDWHDLTWSCSSDKNWRRDYVANCKDYIIQPHLRTIFPHFDFHVSSTLVLRGSCCRALDGFEGDDDVGEAGDDRCAEQKECDEALFEGCQAAEAYYLLLPSLSRYCGKVTFAARRGQRILLMLAVAAQKVLAIFLRHDCHAAQQRLKHFPSISGRY